MANIFREKSMKFINSALFLVIVLIFGNVVIAAQESEAVVVDEVVAVVNDGVITLSRIKRESQNAVTSLVQEGKSEEEAKTLVESKKGELIANLINEELLMQRAKEMGIDSEVEAVINQRLTEIMKQQNIKTLDALYKEMERAGVNPQDYRENMRLNLLRDGVVEREVYGRIYWSLGSKEIKDYYEKNKAKFTKPETISVSEIFLSFAGRDEAAVREKAKQLVAQARGGADFEKLVLENSDRPDVAQTKGKLGTANFNDIADEKYKAALKDLKVGGVTDPIEIVEGLQIFRVDARTGASSESVFDETAVRRAIATERFPEERRKYMNKLRQEAYIKINDTFRPIVAPVLAEARTPEKPEN